MRGWGLSEAHWIAVEGPQGFSTWLFANQYGNMSEI